MANPNLENESLITLDKNQYGIVYLERLKDEWGKKISSFSDQQSISDSEPIIKSSTKKWCAGMASYIALRFGLYFTSSVMGGIDASGYWNSGAEGGRWAFNETIGYLNNTIFEHSLSNSWYEHSDVAGEITRSSALSINFFMGTYAVLIALLMIQAVFSKPDQVETYLRTGQDFVPRITWKRMIRSILDSLFAIAPALAFFSLTQIGGNVVVAIFILAILVGVANYFINLLGAGGTWATIYSVKDSLTPKKIEEKAIEKMRAAILNELSCFQQSLFEKKFEVDTLKNMFGLSKKERKEFVMQFMHQEKLASPTNFQLFRRGAWKTFSVSFASSCAIADVGYIKLAVDVIKLGGVLGIILRTLMTLCGMVSFSGLTFFSVSSTLIGLLSSEKSIARHCRPYLYGLAVGVIFIDAMLSGASETLVNYLLDWPGVWGTLITLLGWPSAAIPNFFYALALMAIVLSLNYFVPKDKQVQATTFKTLGEIREIVAAAPRDIFIQQLTAFAGHADAADQACKELCEWIKHAFYYHHIEENEIDFIFTTGLTKQKFFQEKNEVSDERSELKIVEIEGNGFSK